MMKVLRSYFVDDCLDATDEVFLGCLDSFMQQTRIATLVVFVVGERDGEGEFLAAESGSV